MLPSLTLIGAKGRLQRVGSEWGLEVSVRAVLALEKRVEDGNQGPEWPLERDHGQERVFLRWDRFVR